MTDTYGGGIYLTTEDDRQPDWDLVVDQSGDIRTVTGESELEKDIAYAVATRLQNAIGGPIRPVTLSRIEARVRDVLEGADRIDSVVRINVRETDGANEVEVVAEASAGGDRVDLVFGVSL